jgi:hypothetical protein
VASSEGRRGVVVEQGPGRWLRPVARRTARRERREGASGARRGWLKEGEGRKRKKGKEEKKREEKRENKGKRRNRKGRKIEKGIGIGKMGKSLGKLGEFLGKLGENIFCGVFRFFECQRDFRDGGDGEADRPAGPRRARDSRRGGRQRC